MLQFMQIYGNCAITFFLHDTRIRGPVDNIVLKNKEGIKLLVEDKYFEYIKDTIKNNAFKITPRIPSFKGDLDTAYDTNIVRIVHNNPFEAKYLENLKIRCKNLKEFLNNINNKDNYLIYTINLRDVGIKTHKLIGNHFEENVKYLKKLGLLDKTIFVATTGTGWLNSKCDGLIPIIKKYNLKYLELHNVKQANESTIEDFNALNKIFIQEVESLLKNGTDKKYLKSKEPKNKPIKKEKQKEEQTYYLYF